MSNRVKLAPPPSADPPAVHPLLGEPLAEIKVGPTNPLPNGVQTQAEAEAEGGSEPQPGAVTVAYVLANEVSSSWHHSMIQLIIRDFHTSGHVARGGYVAMRCGTGNLVQARNTAVVEFLSDREGEWLFWVDTDMGFEPDTIERLLAVADPVARPVVGALCFVQREISRDGFGGHSTLAAPTIFDWIKVEAPEGAPIGPDGVPVGEQTGFAMRYDYTPNAVVPCKGTGSACILIHRSVFERVAQAYGPTWYNRIPNPSMGELTSEDLSFCMRLGTLDIPVYVHTGVKTTHQKTQWVGEDVYAMQRAVVELREHFQAINRPAPVAVPVVDDAVASEKRTDGQAVAATGEDRAEWPAESAVAS